MNEQLEFYSQIGQDQIVFSLFKGKRNGTFLDIGCGSPKHINNTYFLEKNLNWRGLSLDLNYKISEDWKQYRPDSKLILEDATNIDYLKILKENNFTTRIDFLSLDLEPWDVTFKALKKIPLEKIQFNCIAYEHDGYRSGDEFKQKTRTYLESYDYILFTELKNQDDIWVHSTFVENLK